MPAEPPNRRAVAFVDGQNLFHAVRAAFGYTFPNYDVATLARTVTARMGWQLTQARFYTGIPDAADDTVWNHFWVSKLAQLGREGVHVFSRPLRYRNRTVTLPDGRTHTVLTGEEKGVDVRLAIDIIRLAVRKEYDVALIFSQDQDLSEVANEIQEIAAEQHRWIKVASAYPVSPAVRNRRGINRTDWIPLDRATYDTCIDTRDYRPKKRP